jgi:hypothetical protein
VIHSRKRASGISATLLALAIALPFPAAAQTVKGLQRQLAERDKIIADLMRRVEALESRASPTPTGAGATQAASPPAPSENATGPSSAPGTQQPASSPTPAGPAPGQFTVDEETAKRALERALVQTGALLLEPGRVEVDPTFSYSHREGRSRIVPLLGGPDEAPDFANLESRTDRLEAGLTLRFGLPFSSQLELSVPYAYQGQSEFIPALNERSSHASGLGDFSMTLSKVLLRESGWQPDLTAELQWDSNTGTIEKGTNIGSGFDELTGSLWAVKRVDPLALIGRLSYTKTFENDQISPGDSFGISLGTVLATSPDTSLRFLLNQNFSKEGERSGVKVPGTDAVNSTLSVGASFVLGPNILLDVQADVGLTRDAPDYAFLVSLPISFDLPIPSGF